MNAKQFYSTVVRMREAQKLYFQTRSPEYLRQAKALEREIDKEIERVNKQEEERRNPTLW